MGAQQSSDQGSAPAAQSAPKTCYYELLAVERQATDDEIKRAYRRKALELHPDRNFHDVETATRKFAEVQAAYDVLSDPQERAWYDSHRDAILSGNDGNDGDGAAPTFRNVRLTSTEEIMSLMRRFNATVPFDDEPTGFFGIARETFEHLALEEEAAAEYEDLDVPEYPTFGSSDDEYEYVVKRFYSSWASFSTRKTFAWKDKYRLSEAPDRRVRRLMEKENKKCRDDAIREFNDAVRFLVTFVRKRDPRYIPNTQTEADRQKSLRNAAAAQAARSRAANQEKMAAYEVPEWAQTKPDNGAEDHFSPSDEASDDEIVVLECVVCNKTFKSDKQLEAHERSKKHVKAVQLLRRQMRKEGVELDLDEPTQSPTVPVSEKAGGRHDMEDGHEGEAAVDSPEQNLQSTEEAVSNEENASGQGELNGYSSPDSADADDYAPREAVQERLAGNEPALSVTTNELSLEDTASQPARKPGKAKMKREKKAAKLAKEVDSHQCSVCNEAFTSRTKLFDHIRQEGHAAAIPVSAAHGRKKRS